MEKQCGIDSWAAWQQMGTTRKGINEQERKEDGHEGMKR